MASQSEENSRKRRRASYGTVVYVYGFAAGTSQEQFTTLLFAPIPNIEPNRIDFVGPKLQAFIHCKSVDDAKVIIATWDKQPLGNHDRALQVRYRDIPETQQVMDYSSQYNALGLTQGKNILLTTKMPATRPKVPFPEEDENFKTEGKAKYTILIKGFPEDIKQADVFNWFSMFGPIYTLFSCAENEFKLRFFHDISTNYAMKHLDEERHMSPIKKQNADLPTDLTLELIPEDVDCA